MENVETKLGAIEIAQDMTVEAMSAIFFDSTALKVPNYRLYQLNSRGERFYYTKNEDGTMGEKMPSVTTILSKVMPHNPFLEKWRATMGLEQADAYTQERANYGTFLHAQLETLLIARTYNLDLLKESLAKYIERENLPISFINYAEDLKSDILAFAQFVRDYDVRPLCIEQSLYSKKGYAGMIDLVANIYKYPHEEGKKAKSDERLIAIIDFKSGRNGFYESHIHQLYLYKDMFEESFPGVKIDSVFNWSPKEWRKAPSYHFKCQDDAIDPRITETLLEQFKLRNTDEKEVTLISGIINLENGIEGNYKRVSYEQLINDKAQEIAEAEKPSNEEESLF